MNLDRPVLVTGTPRSGKSVVANLLAASPELCLIEEPLMVWDLGLGTRADDVRTADEASPEVCRGIRSACAAAVRRAGKLRYMDHLAYHALRLPFVNVVLPEARIIHIIRRPETAIPEMLYGWTFRDTVGGAIARRVGVLDVRTLPRHALRFAKNYIRSRLSGRRATWGPRVPGLSGFAAGHSPALVAAFQWMHMVRRGIEDGAMLPEDRYLEMRFERLLADPRRESARICRFADVADPDAVIDCAADSIDPDFPFEKKVYPTPEEWEKIRDLIDPVFTRLGYESWSPPESSEACAPREPAS